MSDDQFDADGFGCFRGVINCLAILAAILAVVLLLIPMFAQASDFCIDAQGNENRECKRHGLMRSAPIASPPDDGEWVRDFAKRMVQGDNYSGRMWK